jgi:hypothetical protein
MTKIALYASAATLIAGTASAQMFGGTYGTDLDYDRFNTGLSETGYYGALDRNDDMMLDRSEYATGLYADYDTDNDMMISNDEFEMGYGRYMGMDGYDSEMFGTYDANADGFLTQEEFGTYYGDNKIDYYDSMDADADGFLNEDEYSTGLYNAADLDQDQVLSIEEEGWFEGWFDGDDIEVEVESVGEVYNDI